MSQGLFPLLTAPGTAAAPGDLPLYREVAWDFEKDAPIFRNGRPVIAEGKDAVLVWAFNALSTQRYRFEIYSRGYGAEHEALIGQAYTEDLKVAEATRYIREALLIHPYITDVREVETGFSGDTLSISCALITVYGEVLLHV